MFIKLQIIQLQYFVGILSKENIKFTTPTQQEYNTPSHKGGTQCVKHTLM
jgi:hypothetical protein